MLKKYKLSFEVWGLLIFLIVMIPNFIWFAIPAPKDILRTNSITETIDTIAVVCQVWMIIALCLFKNNKRKKLCITPFIILAASCCFLYFVSWIIYYTGIVNVIVLIGLTIPPCLAFLFYAIDRKNGIAIIPILVFTVCHMIYSVTNFIIWQLFCRTVKWVKIP